MSEETGIRLGPPSLPPQTGTSDDICLPHSPRRIYWPLLIYFTLAGAIAGYCVCAILDYSSVEWVVITTTFLEGKNGMNKELTVSICGVTVHSQTSRIPTKFEKEIRFWTKAPTVFVVITGALMGALIASGLIGYKLIR